jgi:hypothetical protein
MVFSFSFSFSTITSRFSATANSDKLVPDVDESFFVCVVFGTVVKSTPPDVEFVNIEQSIATIATERETSLVVSKWVKGN